MKLSLEEIAELKKEFEDLINYESEDPCKPIDPLTYTAPDGDTCLHAAVLRGNLRAVELLVKAGLDVNQQGDMGCTPLHYAKTKEIYDFLLKNGASSEIVNEFGKTPAYEQQ
jgi:ankyrin repeat protein